MSAKDVTVYIQDTCVHCHKQINWMESEGYKFTTKELTDEKNRKEFFEYEATGTPFTVIHDGSGKEKLISGFQKEAIKKALH